MDLIAGHVYFIGQTAAIGPIKIGSSGDPLLRLKALQIGSPVSLTLLASFPSDDCLQAERNLHRRFRASHSHGEWFIRTPELLTLIDSCRTTTVRVNRRLSPTDAARVVTLREASRTLSCSLDCARMRAQRRRLVPAGRQGNALTYRLGDLA